MRREENREIRAAILLKGLKHWEVAEHLGIQESALSRMLRRELSEDEKKKLLKAIDEMEAK